MFEDIRELGVGLSMLAVCGNSSTTAKYQRPVQWDGRQWVADKARLMQFEQCLQEVALTHIISLASLQYAHQNNKDSPQPEARVNSLVVSTLLYLFL